MTHKLASTDIHAGVPRSLSQIAVHNLGYKASWLAGFGFNNDVLIGHSPNLYMFHFNGKEYTQTWEKQVPVNMNEDYEIAITQKGEILLQQDTDSPTFLYSRPVQQQQKF